MKVLHTSDWHLGMAFRGRDIREDQEYFIEQIKEIIRQEQAEAVLLAGDIFDRSVASAAAIALYDKAMTDICGNLGIPVLLVAGNHDGGERLASCSALLQKAGLYIAGTLQRDVEPITLGDADFYLLPWFSLEKVRSLYPEQAEELQTLEQAYELVCNRIRDSFRPHRKHILVAHAFVVGVETSVSDRSAEVGTAAAVSARVFRDFDYVALGHIHGPQNAGENIRYSGTPMPYSFGKEEKQEKSVTIIDTSVTNIKEHLRAVPLEPLHERVTLKGTYEQLISARDITERRRQGYVRLEVEDIHVGMETFAALQEVYPSVLEVAGKHFEQEDSRITMTLEELECREADPMEVFKRYFMDTNLQEPTEHFLSLFQEALEDYEKEVAEG